MKQAIVLCIFLVLCSLLTQAPWWVGIAAVAVALYGGAILVDAIMFEGEVYETPLEPMLVTAVLQGVPLVLVPWSALDATSTLALAYAFVAGIVNMLGYLFYFKAMDVEQDPVFTAITINVVIALVPLFAYLFVGEELKPLQYLGIFCIFGGAVTVSFAKAKTSPAVVLLMFGAVVALSLSTVMMKGAYNLFAQTGSSEVYWTGYVYRTFGCLVFAASLSYFLLKKQSNRSHFVGLVKSYWPIFLLTEGFQVGGDMLSAWAATAGEIGVVTALDGGMALFILTATVLIGFFARRFGSAQIADLAEVEFQKQTTNFGVKLGGMIAIILGAYLAT